MFDENAHKCIWIDILIAGQVMMNIVLIDYFDKLKMQVQCTVHLFSFLNEIST